MPTPADFRLMTEATGQRIAAALEALSGTPAAAAAARQNLDVYSTSETDAAIQQSTANINIDSGATGIPSKSVANGTFTTMATFTPSANGSYIIVVDMEYGTATQGNRILLVDVSETSSNNATNSVLADGRAILEKTRIFSLMTSDTVYIRAYQNSGSALSCSGSYRVLRLK